MHINTDSKKCSGCTACKTICPVNAIKMIPDDEGFEVPVINKDICIDCGACIKVCPADNGVSKDKRIDNESYAVRWTNTVRKKSASGAFFPAVAKYFIEEKQGYVCGCVLDDSLVPIHIVSNKWDDIVRMQDSKYVQSNMEECYSEIIELLQKGKWVLFTGTSCQAAGLLSLIQTRKINRDHLLLVDFFCHGVPSPRIWKDYIKFYHEEKRRQVVGYRFRSKKYGWGEKARGSSYLNCIQYTKRHKAKFDNYSYAARMWRTIFFSNICIRQYCHTCPYATVNKPADITMGDFWGIDGILKDFDDGKGCSAVILRTEYARKVFDELSYLDKRKVNVEDITKRQKNAFEPSESHPLRSEFWNDYKRLSFKELSQKYFYYTNSRRIKDVVKRILFTLHLRNIY